MTAPEAGLPRLDFGSWTVSFPGRGHHAFLASHDLRTTAAAEPPSPVPGLWLVRTESGAGVIIPDGVQAVRDGSPVVGLAVLHHGEKVEVANHLASFREIQRVVLEPESRLIGRSCPYCRTTLAAQQPVIRCPLCGEAYCVDCWEVLIGARCCSRNCRLSPGPLAELGAP